LRSKWSAKPRICSSTGYMYDVYKGPGNSLISEKDNPKQFLAPDQA
jgi:hypothetical protein